MPWFKVDDTLSAHPKARNAGLPAMGLWVVSGSYASQYLTEGFVPEWFVVSWPSGRKHAQALVDAGLWSVVDGGWLFHQWQERQPTKEQVEADRAATRDRQQRWRDRKRDKAVSNGVSNAVTNGATNGAPTRPDPITKKKPSSADADAFAEFWKVYPRKVGKQDAQRVFTRCLKQADPDAIIAGARRYRDDPNRADEFTAHPSTWLHRGGWDDDPLPPRTGRLSAVSDTSWMGSMPGGAS